MSIFCTLKYYPQVKYIVRAKEMYFGRHIIGCMYYTFTDVQINIYRRNLSILFWGCTSHQHGENFERVRVQVYLHSRVEFWRVGAYFRVELCSRSGHISE